MAIHAVDLTAPLGYIEASMFPEEVDLEARLTSYIAEGYARSESIPAGFARDDAAAHWAYHRAYFAVYVRLSASPNTAALVDEGSRTFTNEQVSRFRMLSEEHKARFYALLPVVDASLAQVTPNWSGPLTNVPTW